MGKIFLSLIILFSILFSNICLSEENDPYGSYEKGICYDIFFLNYRIIQKINKNHYFAVRVENYEYTNTCLSTKCHAIIQIDSLKGIHLNGKFEWKGAAKFKLQNGFDTEADLLKECVHYHKCENGKDYCPGKK